MKFFKVPQFREFVVLAQLCWMYVFEKRFHVRGQAIVLKSFKLVTSIEVPRAFFRQNTPRRFFVHVLRARIVATYAEQMAEHVG